MNNVFEEISKVRWVIYHKVWNDKPGVYYLVHPVSNISKLISTTETIDLVHIILFPDMLHAN
jgi:hypothetical protein